MPVDVRAVAIRFADLWSVDHHQMVDEIYSPAIVMESMAKSGPAIRGADELHTLEDRLAERIPAHRHELVRVLVDDDRAFLETTVVAPISREYAQAAVRWELDANGQVAAEVGWFDWEHRTTDSRRSRGTVPAHDHRPRSRDCYAEMVESAVETWQRDPPALLTQCSTDCVVDLIGRTSWYGRKAAADAIDNAARVAPDASITVLRILGEGGVVAALVQVTAAGRTTRATIVATLNSDDQVTSVRLYLDWSRATPAQQGHHLDLPHDKQGVSL